MKKTAQKQLDNKPFLSKKSFEELNQENALLKYRLSEIVDENEDGKILQLAEYFQNELLLKDEMLKNLMKKQQQFSNPRERDETTESIKAKQEKLQLEFLKFEEEFVRLSKEFHEKLVQHL